MLKSENGFPLFDLLSMTCEEFIERLSDIQFDYFPDDNTFEILVSHFHGGGTLDGRTKESIKMKEICPRGIISGNEWLVLLHTMEEWASQYGVLPCEGGVFDQPDEIFEAFNTIMSTRAYFQNKQHEDMMRKIDKK